MKFRIRGLYKRPWSTLETATLLRQNVRFPNKNVSGWHSLPIHLGNYDSESNAEKAGENESTEDGEGGDSDTDGPI